MMEPHGRGAVGPGGPSAGAGDGGSETPSPNQIYWHKQILVLVVVQVVTEIHIQVLQVLEVLVSSWFQSNI